MKLTKKHVPMGELIVGIRKFYAVDVAKLATEGGRPLDGVGWLAVDANSKDELTKVYAAPCIVLGGAFISRTGCIDIPGEIECLINFDEVLDEGICWEYV